MASKNSNEKNPDENLHSGHRKRMRSKLNSIDSDLFENHELLEFMLFNVIPRGNTNDLAHRLLNHFNGSISDVFNAPIEELVKIKGVGRQTAIFLHTIPILSGIYNRLSNASKKRLSSDTLYDYCISTVSGDEDECFVIVLLNASCEIINSMNTHRECLSKDSLINIRAMLSHILPYAPAFVLFIHKCNYDDEIIHKNVIKNLKAISMNIHAISIPFIDYIIVHNNQCISMQSMKPKFRANNEY